MNEFVLRSVADWQMVLQALKPYLKPGIILAVSGPLGAGKTTFTQALAKELGITQEVKSPTFALMRTLALPAMYQDIKQLVHIDAYRLEKDEDARALDLETVFSETDALTVIEWPERIQAALQPFRGRIVWINIQPIGSEERKVVLRVD